MNYEIRLIPTAEETYLSLTEQLRQQWGDEFVRKFQERVSKSINLIRANPYLYAITHEFTGTRKCVLHKNCSMFYKIKDNTVLITWFWDNRQDPIFFL